MTSAHQTANSTNELTPTCGCDQPAQFITHIHHIDHCHDDGVTPDGAEISLLCRGCLAKAVDVIHRRIERRVRWPIDGRVECATCGRPASRLSDLLEVEEL